MLQHCGLLSEYVYTTLMWSELQAVGLMSEMVNYTIVALWLGRASLTQKRQKPPSSVLMHPSWNNTVNPIRLYSTRPWPLTFVCLWYEWYEWYVWADLYLEWKKDNCLSYRPSVIELLQEYVWICFRGNSSPCLWMLPVTQPSGGRRLTGFDLGTTRWNF